MLTLIKNSKELLGMNARNLSYIRPNNLQSAIRLANNKLRSKEALFKADIPVPKVYGIVRNRRELEFFKWGDLPKSFVLKPNCGGGGKGIKVIFGQNKDLSWVSTEGGKVTIKDLRNHIMDIFEGFYSFSGASDIAFFEERIQLLKTLKPYSYKGIPDIRVIVYNKVPVMAMLRLPTKKSDGKANLHLGGVGLGVDIATGVTTNAVMRDQLIEKHPDTKLILSGIKIPYWKEILEIAIKCQEVSKLGYIGVDIAIDSERGPVILEINAHAGLSIQIANLSPLKYRLQKVSGLKVKNEVHGIRIAQDLFGGEIEEEIEEISGKQILGIIETIKIKYDAGIKNQELGILPASKQVVNKEIGLEITKGSTQSMEPTKQIEKIEKEIELKAKIDTGADFSSIDKNLAKKLGYGEIIDEFDEAVSELNIDGSSTKKILDEKIKDKLAKWGENFDTVVIKSSHGVTYRLFIKMNIELSEVKLISKMSVTDRSNLEFPVIIGRKSLGRFLVDPSKSYSYLSQALGRGSFSDKRRRDADGIIKSILEAEESKQKEDLSFKERIVFYSEEIEKAARQFNDIFSFIVPSGSVAKSCLAEINLFLENRDKKEYNPIFKYPVLKILKKEQFETALKKLDNICETVQLENSDLVKEIIQEAAFLSRDKINFLMFVKQKDEAKSFEYAKRIYGDINNDLVEKAEEIYKKLLENKKDEQKEDEQVVYLRGKIFNSKQIKNKFEKALDIMELQEWNVALDKEAGQIDVKFNSAKYELPTIVIPQKRKLNGIDLAKTIIHEVIHLKTNSNNNAIGFGGVIFGRDYELYQEGFARIISNDFVNDIFGAEKELPNPYYILAMDKIKSGFNFHQVFDYIYELKTKECKAKNVDGYNAEEIARKGALFICKRIFRGFRESLSKGKAYFPKDKMYMEGEILAKKMRDNNLENYLIAAKIDPYLLPLFIKLGIIDKDKIKYNLDGDLETYRKLFLEW
jgi:alpha-L-glutamate ligase-like protein